MTSKKYLVRKKEGNPLILEIESYPFIELYIIDDNINIPYEKIFGINTIKNLYGLMDIYSKFINPFENIDIWFPLAKVEKRFLENIIKNGNSINKNLGKNINKNTKNSFLYEKYIKNNPKIILTSWMAYKKLFNRKIADFPIEIFTIDIKGEIEKLKNIFGENIIIKIKSYEITYIDNIIDIYSVENNNILRIYQISFPMNYNKINDIQISNYHGIIFTFLLKSLIEKKSYDDLIYHIYSHVISSEQNPLKKGSLQVFQNVYLEDGIKKIFQSRIKKFIG